MTLPFENTSHRSNATTQFTTRPKIGSAPSRSDGTAQRISTACRSAGTPITRTDRMSKPVLGKRSAISKRAKKSPSITMLCNVNAKRINRSVQQAEALVALRQLVEIGFSWRGYAAQHLLAGASVRAAHSEVLAL